MSKEAPRIPDWARRERLSDMAWITENAEEFWAAARTGFDNHGRGAVAVDTTKQPLKDRGNPMAYLSQELIEGTDDEDLKRMVRQYNPDSEFVAQLLKGDRDSKYRIQLRPR